MRFAFAGDREIAARVLKALLECGDIPSALLLSETHRASHDEELLATVGPEFGNHRPVLRGSEFREVRGQQLLAELNLDMVLSVHFPYLVPPHILEIPRRGWFNLHPSYLPHNRGWHTTTWAILDGTPAGATLHQMSPKIDAGPIVMRQKVDVQPSDTADTLYKRTLVAEFDLFLRAWPLLRSGDYKLRAQRGIGKSHTKQDIEGVRRLELEAATSTGSVIRRLRALTTTNVKEAAYYEQNGRRYHVQISITEFPPLEEPGYGEDNSER
jgi:methionyl-tRNA formyltransferase